MKRYTVTLTQRQLNTLIMAIEQELEQCDALGEGSYYGSENNDDGPNYKVDLLSAQKVLETLCFTPP